MDQQKGDSVPLVFTLSVLLQVDLVLYLVLLSYDWASVLSCTPYTVVPLNLRPLLLWMMGSFR